MRRIKRRHGMENVILLFKILGSLLAVAVFLWISEMAVLKTGERLNGRGEKK